jgi:hypothetical protein
VPAAVIPAADVPLPYTTPFAVRVVAPVPPLATGRVPVTPVVKGNPVALVNTPDVGVPRRGVTNVGDVLRTTEPVPVEEVTPVPPLATGRVPVTPVVRGKPVALVSVAEAGVPNAVALPEASKLTDLPAGYVANRVTVPLKVTAVLELLELKIVVRVKVGPVVEYVPIPTSQLVPSLAE